MLKSHFIKLAGLRPKASNFIKKRLQYRCFPAKCAKFLRTPYFREQLRWLLLKSLIHYLNSFAPNAPFLYPLKTSEHCKAFRAFSGGIERMH